MFGYHRRMAVWHGATAPVEPPRADPEALRRLVAAAGMATPVSLAGERLLPLAAPLDAVVGGLRRGSVVSVGPSPGLALQVAAGPSGTGSWVAAVGLPGLGAVAAAEAGVDLARLLVVDVPPEGWTEAVAAAVDGIDVVLAGVPPRLRAGDARRLAARVRERGTVLVAVDGLAGPGIAGGRWPERADLGLRVTGRSWAGLGAGHGHLSGGNLEVVVSGRGVAGRERAVAVPWAGDR